MYPHGRFRWPRGQRRRYAAIRLLGLCVRIPTEVRMSGSCESCVLCRYRSLLWSDLSSRGVLTSVYASLSVIRFNNNNNNNNTLHLTLNIPSLARQRLPSWGPRRTPWFFCNFSTVWCGRLLKFCFLGFWNYNSVIQALLASNILCLFISTEVTDGHGTSPHSLIIHPASEQCHILSTVGGPFFKFTTFRT